MTAARPIARGLALGLALAVVACGGGRSRDPDAFNVLIVALDACRAGVLQPYGFERETTPALDALARDPDATIYRRHYVQASWTKPSTASLFTGHWVSQHGIYLGVSEKALRSQHGGVLRVPSQALPDEATTLAERLQGLGFDTFAVMMNHHLAPTFGLAQGFRTLVPWQATTKRGDAEKVRQTLELVRAQRRPFFGYVHLHGCHFPFPRWRRHPDYMRRHAVPYDEEARQREGVSFLTARLRQDVAAGTVRLTAEDARFLRLVYEAQLRSADETAVAPLLQGLRDLDAFDDTLIAVTADHGEELYEHAGYGHGHALWEELIHVPLIVKFPRGRRPPALGAQVTALTRSIDVLPSVLAFAGLPADAALPGASILGPPFPALAVAEAAPAHAADAPAGHRRAVIEARYKLIETDAGPLLFDLAVDPREQTNLAAAHPDVVARLAAAAAVELARGSAPDARPITDVLDRDAASNLRELGYVE